MQGMADSSGPAAQQNLTAQWNSTNDKLISAVADYNIAVDALNTVSDLIPGGSFPQAGVAGLGFVPQTIAGVSVGGVLLIIATVLAAIAAVNALMKKIFGKDNAFSKIIDSVLDAVDSAIVTPLLIGLVLVGAVMMLGKE
jgi:hypothetical protein